MVTAGRVAEAEARTMAGAIIAVVEIRENYWIVSGNPFKNDCIHDKKDGLAAGRVYKGRELRFYLCG